MTDEDAGKASFTKYDKGKLSWSKFCWRAAAAVLEVMHHGAEKYGWDNWRRAEEGQLYRYLDASMRHMVAEMRGEVVDEDSGLLAVQHAACSLMFYLEHKMKAKEKLPTLDDAKRASRGTAWHTCTVCNTTYFGSHGICS